MFINSSDYQAWIERNKILQEREDLIYVAYVKAHDTEYWNSPSMYPGDLAKLDCETDTSSVLLLASAMKRCGFLTRKGVQEIANIWRPRRMSNDFDIAIEEGATLVRLGTVLFEGISG